MIPETDESDNVLEFGRSPGHRRTSASQSTPAHARLPDLKYPSPPRGGVVPSPATSYAGDTSDGPLSVDVTRYLSVQHAESGTI